MKPAWHEVVASLETSLDRGSLGGHPQSGGNGRIASIGIARAVPLAWHETVVDRPATAPVPAAAPSGPMWAAAAA